MYAGFLVNILSGLPSGPLEYIFEVLYENINQAARLKYEDLLEVKYGLNFVTIIIMLFPAIFQ